MYILAITICLAYGLVVEEIPATDAGPTADRILTLRLAALVKSLPECEGATVQVDVLNGRAVIIGSFPHPNAEAALRLALWNVPGLQRLSFRANDKPMVTIAERLRRVQVQTKSPRFAQRTQYAQQHQKDHRVRAVTTNSATPTLPTDALASTYAAVVAVLQQDERFAGLQFTLHEGVLQLHGYAERYDDVALCKARLRQIPGIQRIRDGAIQAR